jgi:superfamily II DNA or RNA helicase
MLKKVDWSEDRAYRTGSENEPVQFYLDGLCHSKSFDLLLGYFSSAAINVLSLGFATFLYSGGNLRMVVNNVLSVKDRDAIKKARDNYEDLDTIDLTDIKQLKRTLDEYGEHFFDCLSWLIANDRIQIKIIKPKNGNGISHYKSGVFSDEDTKIGFKASCNFTAFGLLENLEELDTFLSWENGRSNKWIKSQTKYFENIFYENADFVDYLEVEDVSLAIRKEFGNKSLNELLIKEKELIEKKVQALGNKKIRKTFEKLIQQIEVVVREPRFPYPGGARPYQIKAYENWVENGYRGIFAMATGTGKTITSLNCLLNEFKKNGLYRAVILVPTTALLQQWKKECAKFNFKNVLTVSTNENWNDDLSFFNTSAKLINTSFIVIVTYASLTRGKFQIHFSQFPNDNLIIEDDAHNMGSPNVSKLLPYIHLEKRIGLSATIDRKYDELGNESIQSFFNDKPPYIFQYTMQEAMKIGWLCKYTYYPHVVPLSDPELDEYLKITRQLLLYIDDSKGGYKNVTEVEKLLLARKRIIHKAANKLDVFKSILKNEFKNRKNLKYTLVYVPEGKEPDYDLVDDSIETEDDISLINEYTKAVSRTDNSIMVKQYTSATTNRDQILEDFEEGKIHVLTSMKCLDEGVDVPRSELAIFCSSTGNPRQFVQRRGRVLRIHKDKAHAVLHDLVVIPGGKEEESTYQMERSLVKKELERVVDFSSLAMNKVDTYEALKKTLEYYNLNLNDFETENN